MTADELWARYSDLSEAEPVDLETFCDMAASGGLGEKVEPETIVDFLRHVESIMLSNIELKLEEAPHFQSLRDEAVERTQRMIARLIERYGTRRPS